MNLISKLTEFLFSIPLPQLCVRNGKNSAIIKNTLGLYIWFLTKQFYSAIYLLNMVDLSNFSYLSKTSIKKSENKFFLFQIFMQNIKFFWKIFFLEIKQHKNLGIALFFLSLTYSTVAPPTKKSYPPWTLFLVKPYAFNSRWSQVLGSVKVFLQQASGKRSISLNWPWRWQSDHSLVVNLAVLENLEMVWFQKNLVLWMQKLGSALKKIFT